MFCEDGDVLMQRYLRFFQAIATAAFCAVSTVSYANELDSEARLSVSEGLDSSAVGKYLSADYAFRNNDPKTAAALFVEALQESPNNPVLLQSAYKLLLFSGQIDEAVEYASKYLERDSKSVSANILIAIKRIQDGEFAEADDILDKVSPEKIKTILSGVDMVIVPFLKMWVKVGQGQYNEALEVAQTTSSYGAVPLLFLNYQKALINDLAGNHEQAAKEYETSLSAVKAPYHFVRAAGNFYERSEQPQKAREVYTQYRNRYPQLSYFSNDLQRIEANEAPGMLIANPVDGVVEVLMEAVRVLYKSALYKEALAYLQLILYLNPDNVETKILLASYYEEFEQYDKAVALYEAIPEDSDFYWASRINMAEDLYNLGEEEEASKKLLALAERNPKNYSALLILGDLLRKGNKFERAAEIYTRIIARLDSVEKYHWPVFFARGICYEREGFWEKAEKDLMRALELYPGQPEVLNYLGYSWIDRGEHVEEARQMVKEAGRARPNDAQIIDSMGWVSFQLGEYDQASAYLERAVELIPYDVIINDHLGDTYWKQGRYVEARYQWKRALKYGPEPLTVEFLENKLKNGL